MNKFFNDTYLIKKTLEEKILPYVQKPSRYIGIESNISKKDFNLAEIKYAIAFPDFYELGMSHIGMEIIYDILNSQANIVCERVYLPYPDMIAKLAEHKIPLFSLESKEPVKNFDIIGFSLQYELSYTNILYMLELSNISVMSNLRDIDDPFVGAGGPCAFNPLPLNDFIDFFIIGDGENVVREICKTVIDVRKQHIDIIKKATYNRKNQKVQSNKVQSNEDEYYHSYDNSNVNVHDYYDDVDRNNRYIGKNDDKYLAESKDLRQYIKEKISEISGVYVPGISNKIKKSIIYDLNSINYINNPLVPAIQTVHNRFSVEIARGCSSGCRFCQAGYIYRPVRERKKETIVDIIKNGIDKTGFEEISLSSLSTGDYSDIESLINNLSEYTNEKLISFSFPSMRIGSLSENILQKTSEIKKTNFTLAPEAGTERLRKIINKNISEEDLLFEVKHLASKGFNKLKLYFMLGLPYERLSDIEGIKDLILKIKKISKQLNITVNVNNFVPKPHTPFQWHPMNTEEELNFKINYLKQLLKPLNVIFKYQDPKVSFIEGLISRGDAFTPKIIYQAYLNGAKLDSERKYFNFKAWIDALKSFDAINLTYSELLNNYLYIQKDLEETLPWDFIDIMVEKEYLKSEFKKSFEFNRLTIYGESSNFNNSNDIGIYSLNENFNNGNGSHNCDYNKNLNANINIINNKKDQKAYSYITENCRKVCHLCGVCDFKIVQPIYSTKSKNHKNTGEVQYIKNDNDAKTLTAGEKYNFSDNNSDNNKCAINDTAGTISAKLNDSKILIRYSKRSGIKYLGHLETVKILLRALRMLNIKISYSESKFSPKPKVSFSNPIPFMAESDFMYILTTVSNWNEIIGITAVSADTRIDNYDNKGKSKNIFDDNYKDDKNNSEEISSDKDYNELIKAKLNSKLPEGLKILEIINVERDFKLKDINLSAANKVIN